MAAAAPGYDEAVQAEVEAAFRMKKQLVDMKRFLADYGLVWVGKDGSEKPSDEELKIAKDRAL